MKPKKTSKQNIFDLCLKTNFNSLYNASFKCEFSPLELPFVLSNVTNSLLKKLEPFENIDEIKFSYKPFKDMKGGV